MTIPPSDVDRESAFTCRVWVKQAVRVLAENAIVKCLDVDALERERSSNSGMRMNPTS